MDMCAQCLLFYWQPGLHGPGTACGWGRTADREPCRDVAPTAQPSVQDRPSLGGAYLTETGSDNSGHHGRHVNESQSQGLVDHLCRAIITKYHRLAVLLKKIISHGFGGRIMKLHDQCASIAASW